MIDKYPFSIKYEHSNGTTSIAYSAKTVSDREADINAIKSEFKDDIRFRILEITIKSAETTIDYKSVLQDILVLIDDTRKYNDITITQPLEIVHIGARNFTKDDYIKFDKQFSDEIRVKANVIDVQYKLLSLSEEDSTKKYYDIKADLNTAALCKRGTDPEIIKGIDKTLNSLPQSEIEKIKELLSNNNTYVVKSSNDTYISISNKDVWFSYLIKHGYIQRANIKGDTVIVGVCKTVKELALAASISRYVSDLRNNKNISYANKLKIDIACNAEQKNMLTKPYISNRLDRETYSNISFKDTLDKELIHQVVYEDTIIGMVISLQ